MSGIQPGAHLVGNLVKSGALIVSFAAKIETPFGFYLTLPQKYESSDEIEALAEWFVTEFRKSAGITTTD